MFNRQRLWNLRNEPMLLVVVGVGILFIVIILCVVFINQHFYRKVPLYCNDILLPTTEDDCRVGAVTSEQVDNIPVGTVVAFYGNDDDIPDGWVLCDGRDTPSNSLIQLDADSEKPAKQLPDLRGRFIRGAKLMLDNQQIQSGGKDTIDLKHAHIWVDYKGKEWHSYGEGGKKFRVDDWTDGLDTKGVGDFPLISRVKGNLHTNQWGNNNVDNRPEYIELRFIIKVY